ncbi:MAG: DUF973 family protein [Pyrobaculum sp.]
MIKVPTDPREVEGLRLLRTGYFLQIIFAVVFAVASILLFTGFSALFNPFAPGQAAAFVIAIVVFLIAAFGIGLYIVIRYFGGGYRLLAEVDSDFKICLTGIRLYLIGIPLIFVGGLVAIGALAAMLVMSPTALWAIGYPAGIAILIIGTIIAFIGYILFGIVGPFKLNSRYEESLLFIGAIFMIIGLLIPILIIVGVILIYMGIGHILERKPAPGP